MHSLQHLLQQAQHAYNGISFSPEKRGEQLIKDCQAELDADLAKIPEAARERYAEGYERFLRDWIRAKARCLSPMITGPARFPVARNNKHNDQERNASDRLERFRQRAMKSIARAEKVPVTVSSELEQARKQLAERTAKQELMKRVNEAHKKYTKDPLGYEFKDFTDKTVAMIINYVPQYSWEPHPFPPYALTNNNSMIKRYKERVADLEAKEERAKETPEIEALGGEGWRIVVNNEDDRLQIFFDAKPDEQLRAALKSHGFRWAPSVEAWQRKLTGNALASTRRFILPLLKELAA